MICFCIACCLVCLMTPGSFADQPFSVFAPDRQNQKVIHLVVSVQQDQVSILKQDEIKVPFQPGGIVFNKKRDCLIVTSGARDGSDVAVISVADELKLVDSSKLAHPAGYTSVDRQGRYFMTANYRSGVIATYPISENGGVGELVSSVRTPNVEAHCVLTTPDNRFAYIPCVKNNNALFQYSFDEATGSLAPLKPFDARPPAMFGPRHAAYHESLPIAYFSNEQQLGVSVHRIKADGQLEDIQHATTMPRRSPFVKGERDLHASDLVVDSRRKRLFVAVRDFKGDQDSVFAFRIEDDGKLSLLSRSIVGDIPWKLTLSPDSKFLLVSHTGDKNLMAYRIAEDGKLSHAASFDWKMAVRDMVVTKRDVSPDY